MSEYEGKVIKGPYTAKEIIEKLTGKDCTLKEVISMSTYDIIHMDHEDFLDCLESSVSSEFLPKSDFEYSLVGCNAKDDLLYFEVSITINYNEFVMNNEIINN